MPITKADPILDALQQGELTVKGEFVWGSNYTFLAEVKYNELCIQAVYKPSRGERPLWDFPAASLAKREVAAYLVSLALGWELVPPTVYRRQAPIGPGSLQMYVQHDPEYHYFNFTKIDRQRLRPVVLFDYLVNNADRKGSHVLVDNEDHMWLIDHGICFHVDDKLRTVIWDFAGEKIPKKYSADLIKFRQTLSDANSWVVRELGNCIDTDEIAAIISRTNRVLARGHFLNPPPNRRAYPWPPV